MERSNKVPPEYVEMVYRRTFGYTPQQLDEIPAHIVERDLLFMYRESVAQKNRQ